MITRRKFLAAASVLCAGTTLKPQQLLSMINVAHYGVQLYTFREAMMKEPIKTLQLISELGFKEIESARSSKGNYYGLSPKEMRDVCTNFGMKLVAGHVHLDDRWEETMDQAMESGQEYLIVSSMPSRGQTIDNYKSVAMKFNQAGEMCRKNKLKFGYHNHAYEFEADKGMILFDILMDQTDPKLVHMELDLGWVVAAGRNPLEYFEKYPGRFPLWHLKDMSIKEQTSTEFGKGDLDIPMVMMAAEKSGVKHIFIEQEEYASTPRESMMHNMQYLRKI